MLLIYEVYTIFHQMLIKICVFINLRKPPDLQHKTIRADTRMRSVWLAT